MKQTKYKKYFQIIFKVSQFRKLMYFTKLFKRLRKEFICYDKTNWIFNIFRNFHIYKKIMRIFHNSPVHLRC
jgi:hypothetical protein